jgi:hypothetical protein
MEMKILKNICSSIFLTFCVIIIAISFFIGCSASRQEKAETEPTDAVALAENSFDPLGDPRDRTVLEIEGERTGDEKALETAARGGVDQTADDDFNWAQVDSFLKAQNLVDSSLTIYRVQLYASQYYTEANYELQIAREIFSDTVLIKYDLPYYKVLLGNTTNEREGRSLLQNARSLGYSNSWLIESAPDSIYYRILFVEDSITAADSLMELENFKNLENE